MYTVNCSTLLTEFPLLERPALVQRAGFAAVEFWWPFSTAVPADADIARFESAITDAGVQLTGLNFFAGDMPGGDRGLISWPARASEFRDNIDVVVGIGERLGCRSFNALYGNRIADERQEAQDETAVENLTLAAAAVARIGGTVLVEPVSGAPDYPLLTADDALRVIARVRAASAAENVKLLADFYHLAVNGDDVAAVIEQHGAEFGHIQIADDPGRGAPGTGGLPLHAWVARSSELGYTGHIGLEYKQSADTAFDWIPREDRTRSPQQRKNA